MYAVTSDTPRCMLLFEAGIKSDYTRKNYLSHLRGFERFAMVDRADIQDIPRDDLQRLLEDYLLRLKSTTSPNSIPSKFRGIRHFCVMNRIGVDWEIIRKMFPPMQRLQTLRSYTAGDVRDMLSCAKSLRDAALIHFLASTGARIGAFDHRLEAGHLRRMPQGCRAVRIYAGHLEEYWAFLTPQAAGALDAYHLHRKEQGEEFGDKTPVFAAGRRGPGQLGWSGARSAVYKIITRSGVRRTKSNGRYDVQVNHGFRKRFNTVLKMNNSVNYNMAEKLMGHKNGLDGAYLTPTLDELFGEFRKAIPDLTI